MNKKFGVDKFLSSLFKSKDEISLLNYEIEKAGYKDFILLDTGKDNEKIMPTKMANAAREKRILSVLIVSYICYDFLSFYLKID